MNLFSVKTINLKVMYTENAIVAALLTLLCNFPQNIRNYHKHDLLNFSLQPQLQPHFRVFWGFNNGVTTTVLAAFFHDVKVHSVTTNATAIVI